MPNFTREEIDPLLWDLIVELNDKSFVTWACCQGRQASREFDQKKHCPAAYVYFAKPLPKLICKTCEEVGLIIYGQNQGVTAITVSVPPAKEGGVVGYKMESEKRAVENWTEEDKLKVLEANKLFASKVKHAFRFEPL